MEAIIAPVPTSEVCKYWPVFKPFVDRVLNERGGQRTTKDLLSALMWGDATLWSVAEERIVAAAETEVYEMDERVCRITCLSGDGMNRWIHGIKSIEQWAKEQGCTAITLSGRKGWQRVLQDYDLSQVTLRKEL